MKYLAQTAVIVALFVVAACDDREGAAQSAHPTWEATASPVISDDQLRARTKQIDDAVGPALPIKTRFPGVAMDALPASFDWRTDAAHLSAACADSLNEIANQGDCGNGWAMAPAAVMTDRICIHSNGTRTGKAHHLSTQDVSSCCKFFNAWGSCGQICDGGLPAGAFKYWAESGVVTGMGYGDKSRCYSNQLPPAPPPAAAAVAEPQWSGPQCNKTCENPELEWGKDKHFGNESYHVYGEKNMKAEIFSKGPIASFIYVFNDFNSYKTGVYIPQKGAPFAGSTTVKILGWGTSAGGVPFWTCANSWGAAWGEDGFFRILRGNNTCSIEASINGPCAGTPRL